MGFAAANRALQTSEQGPAEVETPEDPNPAPVFNSHPDAIPPDASELSITGDGFSEATEIYFDDQPNLRPKVRFSRSPIRARGYDLILRSY